MMAMQLMAMRINRLLGLTLLQAIPDCTTVSTHDSMDRMMVMSMIA